MYHTIRTKSYNRSWYLTMDNFMSRAHSHFGIKLVYNTEGASAVENMKLYFYFSSYFTNSSRFRLWQRCSKCYRYYSEFS